MYGHTIAFIIELCTCICIVQGCLCWDYVKSRVIVMVRPGSFVVRAHTSQSTAAIISYTEADITCNTVEGLTTSSLYYVSSITDRSILYKWIPLFVASFLDNTKLSFKDSYLLSDK